MNGNIPKVTSTDGVDIHMFDLKSGGEDELLMLHGVGRAGRTFSSFATMLPERFHIRTLDFRGHGKSGRAGDRYRVVDYVLDAVAAIEAIGKPVVVYGHSLGSLVAAALAACRPKLVTAIVLEDPPSPGFWKELQSTNYYPTFTAMHHWADQHGASVAEIAKGFGQEVLKTFGDGRVMRVADVRDPVNLRFTASCLRDLDSSVMKAILEERWAQGYEIDEIFRAIQCPSLILRGDVAKGGMLPEADAESLINLLADGTKIDFPTAGHLLHWQVRSEAAMHTSAFLESL